MNFNKTKNIARRAMGLFLMFSAAMAFNACSSDEEAFFTAEENDSPRILNTDIPEWSNGEPAVLTSVSLPNNFAFKVIATPIHYTTVKWYLDNELIYEGDSIDQKVLAGNYELKIVATTTKGKETSRTCRLIVNAAEGDPVMGTKAKELWVAPGATTTVHGGQNLDKVAKIKIGGVEATNVKVAGDAVTFTVPASLAEGKYRIVLEGADGAQYGGGQITVTKEAFPDKSETLWEGEFNVTWDTPFKELQNTFLDHAKAGTILKVYVSGNGQGTATTAWWNNLLTGKGDPNRGDIMISGSMVLEYELTDFSIKLMKEQDGFFVVGNGYTVKKVTVE